MYICISNALPIYYVKQIKITKQWVCHYCCTQLYNGVRGKFVVFVEDGDFIMGTREWRDDVGWNECVCGCN